MEKVRKQKKKPGRPAKAIKKEIRITIRFTGSEYFVITEKAQKSGVNPSAYVRQVAIYSTVKTRLTEEERHFVRQLVGMANNVNQMAKLAHQEGLPSAMYHYDSYRKQIDDLLKRLKNDK